MFCNPELFDFVSLLEQNWLVIKQELDGLTPKDFLLYPERYVLEKRTGWDICGLYFLGVKIDLNCDRCPQTARIVEQIPGMITAAYSHLSPGIHILPHSGKPIGVLRCHLGLDIPERCGIRVGDQTRRWENGRCLVFDDTFEHEAWNLDHRSRTVLLIDFQAPDWYLAQTKVAA